MQNRPGNDAMNLTLASTTDVRDEIVRDSIRRGLRIAVTYRPPEGWRVFKSAFVSCHEEPRRLLVSRPGPPDRGATELPPVGATVGVNFRVGHKKCMFATTRLPDVNDDQCMVLDWPVQLYQMQRRAYRRVSPPRDAVVTVRLWRVRDRCGESSGERESFYGELEDFSAGGIRVNVAESVDIRPGETIECLFVPRPGAQPLLSEITLRHREAAGAGRAFLGFQFIGLETTAEGRTVLTRLAGIVRQYQRAART
jgi:c-di-GMP-binding flagellar brake protein YcgR